MTDLDNQVRHYNPNATDKIVQEALLCRNLGKSALETQEYLDKLRLYLLEHDSYFHSDEMIHSAVQVAWKGDGRCVGSVLARSLKSRIVDATDLSIEGIFDAIYEWQYHVLDNKSKLQLTILVFKNIKLRIVSHNLWQFAAPINGISTGDSATLEQTNRAFDLGWQPSNLDGPVYLPVMVELDGKIYFKDLPKDLKYMVSIKVSDPTKPNTLPLINPMPPMPVLARPLTVGGVTYASIFAAPALREEFFWHNQVRVYGLSQVISHFKIVNTARVSADHQAERLLIDSATESYHHAGVLTLDNEKLVTSFIKFAEEQYKNGKPVAIDKDWIVLEQRRPVGIDPRRVEVIRGSHVLNPRFEPPYEEIAVNPTTKTCPFA